LNKGAYARLSRKTTIHGSRRTIQAGKRQVVIKASVFALASFRLLQDFAEAIFLIEGLFCYLNFAQVGGFNILTNFHEEPLGIIKLDASSREAGQD
jgi:hypothetical protein